MVFCAAPDAIELAQVIEPRSNWPSVATGQLEYDVTEFFDYQIDTQRFYDENNSLNRNSVTVRNGLLFR